MLIIIFVIATLFFCSSTSLADWTDHPSYGHPTEEPRRPANSQPIPAEWTQGDMIFPEGGRPAWGNLSPTDRFIVAGTTSSSLGSPLMPWSVSIFTAAKKLHQIEGHIPPVLDEEKLRKIPELKEASAEALSIYRNPFTGEWPRLDVTNPAPGGVYIRPLTQSEIEQYKSINPAYRIVWAPNLLQSDVYYFRVYGQNSTLVAMFMYVMSSN